MTVKLTDHRTGMCHAIIGEVVRGEVATCCGEPTVSVITLTGREVESPWCAYHRALYVRTDFRRDKPLRPPPKKVFKVEGMRMPWCDPTKYMSVVAAGRKYFDCANSKAYALAREGTIPTIKVSGRPVVVIAEMDRLMADREKAAAVSA